MSRSVKKGPFIEARLLGRIEEMNKRNEKKVVKTGLGVGISRRSSVTPSPTTTARTCPGLRTENMSAIVLVSPAHPRLPRPWQADPPIDGAEVSRRCVCPPPPSTSKPRPARPAGDWSQSRVSRGRSPLLCGGSCRRRPRRCRRACRRAPRPTPRTTTTCRARTSSSSTPSRTRARPSSASSCGPGSGVFHRQASHRHHDRRRGPGGLTWT